MKKLLLRPVSAAERMRLWLLKQSWFHGLLSAMPRQLRWLLRTVYLAPIDLADRVLGRRDAGLPSKAGTFTGAFSDFEGSGRGAREGPRRRSPARHRPLTCSTSAAASVAWPSR